MGLFNVFGQDSICFDTSNVTFSGYSTWGRTVNMQLVECDFNTNPNCKTNEEINQLFIQNDIIMEIFSPTYYLDNTDYENPIKAQATNLKPTYIDLRQNISHSLAAPV